MKTKIRAQVKSRFYYVFWGTATVAVVLGQLYVGTGYRMMANSVLRLMADGFVVQEVPYDSF
jgi:hypothetical protein